MPKKNTGTFIDSKGNVSSIRIDGEKIQRRERQREQAEDDVNDSISKAKDDEVVLHTIYKCSNLACPNTAYGGSFSILKLRGLEGLPRPLLLVLCRPCAEALREAINEK